MAIEIKYTRWTAEGLPDGLSINEDTGVISGVPNVPIGTYTAYITVETNYGYDGKYITIVVDAPASWRPLIEPEQVLNVMIDVEVDGYEVRGSNVRKTV